MSQSQSWSIPIHGLKHGQCTTIATGCCGYDASRTSVFMSLSLTDPEPIEPPAETPSRSQIAVVEAKQRPPFIVASVVHIDNHFSYSNRYAQAHLQKASCLKPSPRHYVNYWRSNRVSTRLTLLGSLETSHSASAHTKLFRSSSLFDFKGLFRLVIHVGTRFRQVDVLSSGRPISFLKHGHQPPTNRTFEAPDCQRTHAADINSLCHGTFPQVTK